VTHPHYYANRIGRAHVPRYRHRRNARAAADQDRQAKAVSYLRAHGPQAADSQYGEPGDANQDP
jgi:hypothetical protein